MNIIFIDGRFVFNSLNTTEIAFDFTKLTRLFCIRKYYSGILKGSKPPAIGEYLRHNGYRVVIRHGDSIYDYIVDMATDIVLLPHESINGITTATVVSNQTILSSAIGYIQNKGVMVTTVCPKNSNLSRNVESSYTLEEYMNKNTLVQARDFTLDKLNARNWIDLHIEE